MQAVTADEINSRNKQKSSQVQTNWSRKLQPKMQTDTADATNWKQKRQHWTNKNQIKKKNKLSIRNTLFSKTPVKQKKNKNT